MGEMVKFETFRSPISSWDKLYEAAAAFASRIGRDKVINVSQSWSGVDGMVTVWYWADRDTNVLKLKEEEIE